MKKIYMILLMALTATASMLTSCSDDDPFFTASENDAPRILNTDIPEGKGGETPLFNTITRTTNFTFDAIVTPANYTTVTWLIDGEQVAEGLSIDTPLLAGSHTVKLVATTTKGLSTSRTFIVNVLPADGDPALAGDAKSRWLTTGTAKTIETTNVSSVAKVLIGKQEATGVSFAEGQLTFNVPVMEEGEYTVVIEDAEGQRYGCGLFTVSNDEYAVPEVTETVLWEGSTEINWGVSNVLISPDVMSQVAVGSTVKVYYEIIDMPEGYHAMRITTNQWGDNAEDQVVPQFDITGDTANPYEFTYTAANKEIVDSREGMLVVGYGYKVIRITTE